SGKERNAVNVDDTVHPALSTNMEDDILGSEKTAQVRKAVAALPPNQREAIQLSYFEGLSQAEVATRMGRPLGTVKSWIRIGMQSLRSELEAFGTAGATK